MNMKKLSLFVIALLVVLFLFGGCGGGGGGGDSNSPITDNDEEELDFIEDLVLLRMHNADRLGLYDIAVPGDTVEFFCLSKNMVVMNNIAKAFVTIIDKNSGNNIQKRPNGINSNGNIYFTWPDGLDPGYVQVFIVYESKKTVEIEVRNVAANEPIIHSAKQVGNEVVISGANLSKNFDVVFVGATQSFNNSTGQNDSFSFAIPEGAQDGRLFLQSDVGESNAVLFKRALEIGSINGSIDMPNLSERFSNLRIYGVFGEDPAIPNNAGAINNIKTFKNNPGVVSIFYVENGNSYLYGQVSVLSSDTSVEINMDNIIYGMLIPFWTGTDYTPDQKSSIMALNEVQSLKNYVENGITADPKFFYSGCMEKDPFNGMLGTAMRAVAAYIDSITPNEENADASMTASSISISPSGPLNGIIIDVVQEPVNNRPGSVRITNDRRTYAIVGIVNLKDKTKAEGFNVSEAITSGKLINRINPAFNRSNIMREIAGDTILRVLTSGINNNNNNRIHLPYESPNELSISQYHQQLFCAHLFDITTDLIGTILSIAGIDIDTSDMQIFHGIINEVMRGLYLENSASEIVQNVINEILAQLQTNRSFYLALAGKIGGEAAQAFIGKLIPLKDVWDVAVAVYNSLETVKSIIDLAFSDPVIDFSVMTTALEITKHPQDLTISRGLTAIFHVTATGTPPLNYQWERRLSSTSDWSNVGENSPTYSFDATDTHDGSQCRVTVNNAIGSVISSVATLTVSAADTAPTIIIHPQSQSASRGSEAKFSVTATGTPPLSYQWERRNSSGSDWSYDGTNSPTYSIPATDTYDGSQCRVTVSNAIGSVSSDIATLTVTTSGVAPTIIVHPQSQSVNRNAEATFSVTASGTSLNYQWERRLSSGSDWSNVGNNSPVYSFPATDTYDGSQCRVTVRNTLGEVTSDIATLTVTTSGAAPIITSHPQSLSVNRLATATFSVTASGVQPLRYQWQMRYSSVGIWSNVGENSPTFSLTALDSYDGSQYQVIVSSASGSSATSNVATLTVTATSAAPVITSQPQSQSVIRDTTVSFRVTASGTAPLSYQWKMRLSGTSDWSDVGTNTSTYSFTATDAYDGAQYQVTVSNSLGSDISSIATLTVTTSSAAPTITEHPQNQSVNRGATVTFNVTATGTAPLSYQWQRRNSNSVIAWSNVGTNSPAYSFPAADTDNGSQYRVIVSNASGVSATSQTATLTITTSGSAPTITNHPQNQTVSSGSFVTFTVMANGTAPLSYKWERRNSSTSGWTDVGTNSNIFSFNARDADNGSQYQVTVSNSFGNSRPSNTATLTVTPSGTAPTITMHPQSLTVSSGSEAKFSVMANGTAPLNYQWERQNRNSIIWTPVGSNSSSYSFPATDTYNGSQYRVTVSNSFGSSPPSNVVALTVTPSGTAPTITRHPQNQTVDRGSTARFSVTASSTTPMSYQWQSRVSITSLWGNVAGATSATYEFIANDSTDGSQYRVIVSNSVGSATSNFATLTVITPGIAPTITIHPQSQTVNRNSEAKFSVEASGTAPLRYQWQRLSGTGGWSNVGSDSSIFSVTANDSSDGAQYRVIVRNDIGNATSSTATLTVIGNATSSETTLTVR